MSEEAGSVTRLFEQLREGNSAVGQQFWERFLPRLLALARKTLTGRPQQVADADDAVQSALVSFWQRIGQGDFPKRLDRNDLWNLLGVFTVRKAMRQVRREEAEKRGGGRVLGESALQRPDGTPLRLDEIAGSLSAGKFDLDCEELLLQLDDELRVFAVLRLLGYRNREIAEQLDCTERKVERKLALMRLIWERHLPS
jgi:RNA polymerase sigma factor (sigma-70 family)